MPEKECPDCEVKLIGYWDDTVQKYVIECPNCGMIF